LFGLGVTDYFTDSGYEVKLEKDLSIKQQFLDVLIIEQESGSQISELPDGLENLSQHNLMTYKSLQQPLDAWALDELIGHYVNYRKQSSPSLEGLLPVEDFALYAVSTRHPEKLEKQTVLDFVKKGVYDVHWGSQQVRLIVLSEVPKIERNALWLLFSGIVENVQYGALNYHWRRRDVSTVMNDLFTFYQSEGFAMPYTVEDYKKDLKKKSFGDADAGRAARKPAAARVAQNAAAGRALERAAARRALERSSTRRILKKIDKGRDRNLFEEAFGLELKCFFRRKNKGEALLL
jgi:hypothetical protein